MQEILKEIETAVYDGDEDLVRESSPRRHWKTALSPRPSSPTLAFPR